MQFRYSLTAVVKRNHSYETNIQAHDARCRKRIMEEMMKEETGRIRIEENEERRKRKAKATNHHPKAMF